MRAEDTEGLRARFGMARVARLATLRADGTARLVPVTFALADDVIAIGIDDVKAKAGRRPARLADVEREPRVALLADHYAEDWSQLWWVRVDGTATVHEGGALHDGAVAALRAKYPQYATARFAAVIAVVPSAWAVWAAR